MVGVTGPRAWTSPPVDPIPSLPSNLLWVDCLSAFGVGVTVLALSGWLKDIEGVLRGLLVFTGIVNLGYGAASCSLAVRAVRPMRGIELLVAANVAWAPVCLGLWAAISSTATVFGVVHLVGEAVHVGAFAFLEWRHRDRLLMRD